MDQAERRAYLETQREKLRNAIAFGVQSKGNLDWAKAQLAAVEQQLAALDKPEE